MSFLTPSNPEVGVRVRPKQDPNMQPKVIVKLDQFKAHLAYEPDSSGTRIEGKTGYNMYALIDYANIVDHFEIVPDEQKVVVNFGTKPNFQSPTMHTEMVSESIKCQATSSAHALLIASLVSVGPHAQTLGDLSHCCLPAGLGSAGESPMRAR